LLVIAPTRELAMQIAEQATAMVTYQHAWTVQAVYGGCSIQRDRSMLHQKVPTILVATPGRLLDLLREKTRVNGKRLFADCLGETRIVVLDEADRLLQAFPSEMSKILSYLPRVEKRQTLLFSATIPAKLKGLLSREGNNILPTDYVRVDCISDDDVSTQTNVRVDQSYVQLRDFKFYLTGLLSIIDEAMKENQFKIVIFFPTAKLVKYVAEALIIMNLPVLSIHSRMGQGARNRASSLFRQAKQSILLTSDVSARGVDYPDVSLVVQVRQSLATARIFVQYSMITRTHLTLVLAYSTEHPTMTNCICIDWDGRVVLGNEEVACWFSFPLRLVSNQNCPREMLSRTTARMPS
jgi:ATP-dependent RNA helicase MSS116